MDVYVDIVELKSRSEFSDIDVDGRVRLYGTFYKPRFQGELEVTEGTVILLSRPFVFSPGSRVVLDKLVPTYSILDLLPRAHPARSRARPGSRRPGGSAPRTTRSTGW